MMYSRTENAGTHGMRNANAKPTARIVLSIATGSASAP